MAGVGTATVDRVLNNRAHVGETTRQRVLQARQAIENGEVGGKPRKPLRFKIFLPADAGPSTDSLARCFSQIAEHGNATIECVFSKKMEPALLARKLTACANHRIDAVAVQALEDPRVYQAVEHLTDMNIPVVELLSGLENTSSIGYVGIDNRAAGRTAGYLMGRLTRQSGTVAIVTGGQLYRIHESREMGFRGILRQGFPHIGNAIVCNGHDDIDGNFEAVSELLQTTPELVGIYNVGGGNQGIVRALDEADVSQEIIFIGHNLTYKTQAYLLDGKMDIVLHLDMRKVAEETIRQLTAHVENSSYQPRNLYTEVITRENTMGIIGQ